VKKNVGRFEELGLDPRLMRGIHEMGYSEAFPIQEKAILPILRGIDVIGQAKTGSGKTAAYGIPLLQLLDLGLERPQALVLAPTRELAVQIAQEVRRLGKHMGAKVVTIYGGQSINVQLEALSSGAQIVVGTPGRVIDLLDHGELDLRNVKYVVLDEADRMLDMGFVEDVEYILEAVPGRRQMSLFSATMPQEVMDLSTKYMSRPEKILVSRDEPSVEELDQYYTFVEHEEKFERLLGVLKRERPSSAIVFCRTKAGAHRLARELEKRFYNVAPLHGDLSQNQRDASMRAFRSSEVDILVATDVAARGIDVPGVQLVVNYDFPEDPLIYFHRVGRTARAGKVGKSIAIVTPDDYESFWTAKNMTKAEIKPLSPEDEAKARAPHHYYRRPTTMGYGRPRMPWRKVVGGRPRHDGGGPGRHWARR
jgi:ATP-dependent RNA helicase DeaD